MDVMQIIGYLSALLSGLILGLIGGGGSIITIPILTYIFHFSSMTTTAYSLFIVGTSATVGTLKNFKKGLVNYKIAVLFALPAIVAVYIARKYIVPIIPLELICIHNFHITKESGIMLFFALLMIFSAYLMIRKTKIVHHSTKYSYPNFIGIILVGISIGLLTGIAGIGGGFLIIPVMVLFLKTPMKKAVATSLFIIAIKSFVGFLGDLSTNHINWNFLLLFTSLSILGVFLGMYISNFVKGEKLKSYFGWLVVLVSTGIFFKEILYKP